MHAAQAAVVPAVQAARTPVAAPAVPLPAMPAPALLHAPAAPVPAFGMTPANAPFAAAAFRGQPIAAGAATADDALAAALLAAKSEASAARERARAAALTWERKRSFRYPSSLRPPSGLRMCVLP